MISRVLFIATLIYVAVSKGESPADRHLKTMQRQCEKVNCSHLPAGFNDNCISLCVSEKCFLQIYPDILEDGELDQRRQIRFKECVKNIMKQCKVDGLSYDDCDQYH